jgi:hypothetical protein
MDALANSGVERRNLAHRHCFGALAVLVLVVFRRSFSRGGCDDLSKLSLTWINLAHLRTRLRWVLGPRSTLAPQERRRRARGKGTWRGLLRAVRARIRAAVSCNHAKFGLASQRERKKIAQKPGEAPPSRGPQMRSVSTLSALLHPSQCGNKGSGSSAT